MWQFVLNHWQELAAGASALLGTQIVAEVVTKKVPWLKPLSETVKKFSDAIVENNKGKRL